MNALHFHVFTKLEAIIIAGGIFLAGAFTMLVILSLLRAAKRGDKKMEEILEARRKAYPVEYRKSWQAQGQQQRITSLFQKPRDPRMKRGYPGKL